MFMSLFLFTYIYIGEKKEEGLFILPFNNSIKSYIKNILLFLKTI